LSRIGQALPSVNHNDPIHLSTNHEHLHLITTVITASLRAPATVHSPSDLVDTTWTLLLLHSQAEYLPCLTYPLPLTCLLLVFSSPARSSVSVVSVLQLCFPIAAARHICGQEEIHQDDLKKSSTHLKSPLHIPVQFIPFNKHTSAFTYLCVWLHMLQKIGPIYRRTG